MSLSGETSQSTPEAVLVFHQDVKDTLRLNAVSACVLRDEDEIIAPTFLAGKLEAEANVFEDIAIFGHGSGDNKVYFVSIGKDQKYEVTRSGAYSPEPTIDDLFVNELSIEDMCYIGGLLRSPRIEWSRKLTNDMIGNLLQGTQEALGDAGTTGDS